ncbi:MAG: AEC family transporter [Spirochaetaceae bacterium]|nr:AEC family transporter [Spirochaetaceae bacterium]
MDNLLLALNVVFPIFVLLGIGYLSSHLGWISKKSLTDLNRFVFRLPLPLVLFLNVYNMDQGFHIDNNTLKVVSVIFFTLTFTTIFMPLILNKKTHLNNGQKGVLTQAWFRCNAIIFGLPVILSLYGDKAYSETSIVIITTVPLLNVLAVVLLELYSEKTIKPLRLIINIFKNPLIIGALFGFIFYGFNIKIPYIILNPMNSISKVATPLAFIILGGTLELSKMENNIKLILLGALGRLIVVPLIAILGCLALGVTGVGIGVVMGCLAAPAAVSSFTMAAEMNSDAELAGQIVVVSTLLSIITIFLWIFILATLGLI